MKKTLVALALCMTASAQANLNIPKFQINFRDVHGTRIIIGQHNNLRGSFEIGQDVLRNWKVLPIGSIGILYPKKHIVKDMPIFNKFISSRNPKNLLIESRSIRIEKKLDRYTMKFQVQRKASCSNREKVILDLDLSAIVNGVHTNCQDLFSFEGTKEQLEQKLDSLPSEINCELSVDMDDINSEFKRLVQKTSNPESCKDWTTGKAIL